MQIRKIDMEQVAVIKKSKMVVDEDQNEDFFEEILAESKEWLPQVEAKVFEKNVLLRIHCQLKQEGVLAKALSVVERLKWKIINVSVIPFADVSLDVTIIAQVA